MHCTAKNIIALYLNIQSGLELRVYQKVALAPLQYCIINTLWGPFLLDALRFLGICKLQ